MKTCSVKACERPAVARGLCSTHHKRLLDTGDPRPDDPIRTWGRPGLLKGKTPEERHGYRNAYQRSYQAWYRQANEERRLIDNEKNRARNQILRAKDRADALQAYGGICVCCGEPEPAFLCIDHINGGGNQHRKEIGGSGVIYAWLRRNNYPEGFQVLCYNCNAAKAALGYCPHQVLNLTRVAEEVTNAA